jgi:hypothetical protein
VPVDASTVGDVRWSFSFLLYPILSSCITFALRIFFIVYYFSLEGRYADDALCFASFYMSPR